jgi:methionyl-tRNA formyltransferase
VRVVFMGTPEFAVPSLAALAEAGEVVGVFTRPDAVSGRGGRVRPSPVADKATHLGIPLFQPRSLRDDPAIAALAGLKPDLIVVAAYGLILPGAVLSAARLGAVNVHASLLPRWRGAAPIQRAILEGDTETGVSIMRMEEGLDTGPFCLQVATAIGEADASQLTERLACLGADALTSVLAAIANGSVVWTPQDEALVTYAEKIAKSDLALSPELTTETALRRVRAATPAAPCRATVADRAVTVVSARHYDTPAGGPTPARVACTKGGVLLGFADGALIVERLKPDGKAEMAAADWARGTRELEGASWGRPG